MALRNDSIEAQIQKQLIDAQNKLSQLEASIQEHRELYEDKCRNFGSGASPYLRNIIEDLKSSISEQHNFIISLNNQFLQCNQGPKQVIEGNNPRMTYSVFSPK